MLPRRLSNGKEEEGGRNKGNITQQGYIYIYRYRFLFSVFLLYSASPFFRHRAEDFESFTLL